MTGTGKSTTLNTLVQGIAVTDSYLSSAFEGCCDLLGIIMAHELGAKTMVGVAGGLAAASSEKQGCYCRTR